MKYIATINKTCATDTIRVYYDKQTKLFILKERRKDEKIIYNFHEKAIEYIDKIGNLYIQMLAHTFFIYNHDKILELIENESTTSLNIFKHDLLMPEVDYDNSNYIYKLNDIIKTYI